MPNPQTADAPVISGEQVAEYRDKGFIIVEDIFSADDLKKMDDALNGLIEDARGLTEHTGVIDLEPTHTPDRPRVRRIKEPFLNHPVFNEMGKHPKLVTALTALIGPDLRMHGSKINLKSADYGSPVEWHQDWAFYPHTNDDVLAVGVMLDNMTEDNGPLLCIPGSHKGPTYDHHQDGHFVGAIDPEASGIDFSKAETIAGRAGSCSFHHVRMMHGSGQNTSGKDRRLLLFQVAAADAWDIRGMDRIGSWEQYKKTMISGEPTNEPRVVVTPIRLPYPEPLRKGSIYESQTLVKNKYFGSKPAAE
ncbi:MAG: phytanoyl-CoA dioxygenase family protein [Rhodospirillales bacterium]